MMQLRYNLIYQFSVLHPPGEGLPCDIAQVPAFAQPSLVALFHRCDWTMVTCYCVRVEVVSRALPGETSY